MRIMRISLYAAAVVLVLGNAARAQITYTFTDLGVGHAWDTPGNWDVGSGYPTSGDTAIIPNGFTCHVEDDEAVGVLTVADGGTLQLCTGKKLTIYDDSTVNGMIEFGCVNDSYCDWTSGAATIEIYNDLTISTGANEEGAISCACVDGVIAAASGTGAVLTLEDSGPGSCDFDTCKTIQIDPDNPYAIDVQVELVNHGKVGCTGDPDCEVTLSTNPKSGCGFWYVVHGGTLIVDENVSGDGTWWLAQDKSYELSTIWVKVQPTSLTGYVSINSGVLDLDTDFCTSGDLHMTDPETHEVDAVIDVAAGKVAKFGGTCLLPSH